MSEEKTPFLSTNLESQTNNNRGIGILFTDLSCEVKISKGMFKGKENRKILHHVSAYFPPGKVSAILGPTGSGKTTLLNILAGRVSHGSTYSISGEIYIGGQPVNPSKIKSRIAYVMQDDALFPTSTVRETITFSARLRLPPHGPTSRTQAVDSVLSDLKLTRCADTFIGSTLLRGISGGERKRVAIGVELVAQPSLLLLDEPTSGLDSHTALEVVQILRDIAVRRNIAIVMTVHQPSSQLFALFDQALVLAEGHIVYRGAPADLPSHFAQLGLPVPPSVSPAEHALFVAQTAPPRTIEELANSLPPITTPQSPPHTHGIPRPYRAPIYVQFSSLLWRELLRVVRDRGTLVVRTTITLVVMTLLALVFKNAGKQPLPLLAQSAHTDPGAPPVPLLDPLFNVLVILAIFAMFSSAQPLMLSFPLERPVFLREVIAGMYPVYMYFLTKSLVELPMIAIQQGLGLLIPYFVIGLSAYGLDLLAMWLNGAAASSMALVFGCLFASPRRAIEVMPLLFTPQMFFSGLFIPISQIPRGLRWIQYICALKYAVNLLAIAEFPSDSIVLRGQDIKTDTRHIAMYYGILGGLIVGFRLLSTLALWVRSRSLY